VSWWAVVLGVCLLVSACGSSITGSVRRAAQARTRSWDGDELRLECAADEIAVEPLGPPDPLTGDGDLRSRLLEEEVAQLTQGGRLYVAWCPSRGCCGRPAEGNMADAVTVRCTDDGACEAVADNFGDCLTVYCRTY
jgi:hypothetical protein